MAFCYRFANLKSKVGQSLDFFAVCSMKALIAFIVLLVEATVII
jgi:hypothetical protein